RSTWPESTCLVASRSSTSAVRWTPVSADWARRRPAAVRHLAGSGPVASRARPRGGGGGEQVPPGLRVPRVHQGLNQPQRARRGCAITGVFARGEQQGVVTLNHASMVTAESLLRRYCLGGLPLKDSQR